MDPTQWEVLKGLFEEASNLSADERVRFLEGMHAADPETGALLEGMLAASERADSFFDDLADEILSRPPWLDDPTAPERSEPDPLIGRSVRQYEIEERVGRGGMGVVYRACDTGLNRTVALKFLPPHLSADEAATKRFLVEARAAAALDHPNICNIHEIAEDELGRLFIAMAFYEGETLKQKIARGPLSIEQALDYASQIATGLEAAHVQDIIHRDIKPGNVIVTPDGLVKILDFGLAKLTDVTVTGTETTLGTVAYMSPEQAKGEPVDQRTDLWSLGVVLYEMLTGERPFKGASTAVTLNAIRHEDPQPPSALRRDVPPELEAVVGQLLAKDREQRPASVEALGLDTGEAILPKGVFAKPRGPWARLRSWPAVAALVVGMAATGVWWFARAPAPGLPEATVAVFPFENLSGDPTLENMGEYAAFGIMDGLSWMDETTVLDWNTVLRALRSGGEGASAQEIAADLSAGTSVTGVFMLLRDTLQFRAQITSVATREVLHNVEASGGSADPAGVVETLKQRVMGALATTLDSTRASREILSRPPSYEAYQAWARGIERFYLYDMQGALDHFREAYQLDTTFVVALIGIGSAHNHLGQLAELDSILALLEPRRSELPPAHQLWVEWLRAVLAGDVVGKLEAARAAVPFDPAQALGLLVSGAVAAGRPEEALQVWEQFDEGESWPPGAVGPRDWPSFWSVVAEAQRMTARHRGQLETARRGREQFPEYLGVRSQEIQALVALGRLDEVDRLLDEVPDMERGWGGWDTGWVFHLVAADLTRDGHAAEAHEVAHRAVSWYRSRDSGAYAARTAQALLLGGRPEEALELIRVAVTEDPDNLNAHGVLGIALARIGDRPGAEAEARWLEELDRPYLRGAHTYWRAAIAAHLGQKDTGTWLLRRALQEGISYRGIHYDPSFAPLWGYEPFEQVIAPKG
jgi:tetratricopeptide (TPR) repeat protein